MMKFKKKNPLAFSNFLKEPLLVQKQILHQQKALDLSYLEPKGQGRGLIKRAWPFHRRQRVKNHFADFCGPMPFAPRRRGALLIVPRPCISGSK